MNRLEEKIYKHLENEAFIKDGLLTTDFAAKECANITEEIAIKYRKFCLLQDVQYFDNTEEGDIYTTRKGEKVTEKELFQEFIKTL